ncbi:MAG: small basic protein [Planctomycetota bacterium]
MTVHKSLKAGGMVKHRNVLTRVERMLKLEADTRWADKSSVLGLPKTKVPAQVGKKKKKAVAEPAAGGAAAPAAAAPAGKK